MIDPFLEEIAEAAESGRSVPRVKVSTSAGDWLAGDPCSAERFRHLSYLHLLQELGAKSQSECDEVFAHFGAEDDDANVLSLESVSLAFGGRGDGLRVPAVRIPLSAVSSWWIAGDSHVEAEASGGGWFGGAMFPVGD